MSADFWSSTQRSKWQLTRTSLVEARRKVLLLEKKLIKNGLIQDYPNVLYDYNMRIYLHNLIIKLGRRLNIRQVALASAEIYLTRFLTRVSLKEINVYLLVTTCLYVACKIEECPHHIRLITSEARNLWPEYIPHDVTKLAEFEFYLIEEMDSLLFLHHPYNSLFQIRDYLEHRSDYYGLVLSAEELQNSWSIINDSYITDLHLLFPPHIIAVVAIYITIVLKKNLMLIRGNNHIENSSNPVDNETQKEKSGPRWNKNNTGGGVNDIIEYMLIRANDQGLSNNPSNRVQNTTTMNGNNISLSNNNNGQSQNNNMIAPNNNNTSNDSSSVSTTQNKSVSTRSGQPLRQSQDATNIIETKGNLQNEHHFQDLQEVDEDTIRINKFMKFLTDSHINLDEVVEVMQDIINLYVVWNRYHEAGVKRTLQYMLLKR